MLFIIGLTKQGFLLTSAKFATNRFVSSLGILVNEIAYLVYSLTGPLNIGLLLG